MNLETSFIATVGWDNVVGLATCHGLDGLGIEYRWGQGVMHPTRPVLGPTQPPVQWASDHFPGDKRPGSGFGHSPSSSAEVKERVQL
jgi:hypothetical protein